HSSTSLHFKQARLSVSGDERSSQQALPGESIVIKESSDNRNPPLHSSLIINLGDNDDEDESNTGLGYCEKAYLKSSFRSVHIIEHSHDNRPKHKVTKPKDRQVWSCSKPNARVIGMGCEITTCSFVTAPLTSHSQPVPDRRKELFLFVTGQFETQRWNRSKVTLFLVSLSQAALEQVQSNLAPRLCHRLHWNRSGATLFLCAPEIFWSSRTVERKWMSYVLVTALRSGHADNTESFDVEMFIGEIRDATGFMGYMTIMLNNSMVELLLSNRFKGRISLEDSTDYVIGTKQIRHRSKIKLLVGRA
ncbi:unnamed protein product, partial [Timema podura]|nr:unnamed protein product [Timema podura]